TGQAKHQSANMQSAEGGTRSHCIPFFRFNFMGPLNRVSACKSVGRLSSFVAGIAPKMSGRRAELT
ncbi:hypothetical protein, partial [Psychrobacter sp. TB20-MNA-CIBAN-0197]|uniref:hypothetical protein n=1 Tax=Psychrobacter sp. TB20-MNA-CIBAN-0197 TaxID=3140453 RepID=UPI00332CEFE3